MISKKYLKENKRAVIICGPTASGKSALGLAVCERFNGSIIGADSRQIYKRLDIGTAKPSPQDMRRISHYMIDIAEITDEFSAVRFAELAKVYIEQIFDSGRIPVVVGGAGLYLEALTRGIVETPPKDDEIRNNLERRIREEGSEKLHEELRQIDAESAGKISPNDPVRLVRALEIFELTGEAPSLIRKTGHCSVPDVEFLWIGIKLPREILYKKINARVDQMVESGLIEEVKKLVDDGMGEALKKKKIVGYTEILGSFEGRHSLQEAIRLIKQHTRNYAWFRNKLSSEWVNPLERGFHGKVFELIDDYLKRT